MRLIRTVLQPVNIGLSHQFQRSQVIKTSSDLLHSGKFPTASEAMKDVGGSYYVVREILQELKYNFKMSSVDTKDTSSEKSATKKKNEISTKTGEVSQARELGELISPISKSDESKDVGTQSRRPTDSSSESSKSDQRPQSSILVKSDGSKDVGTQFHHPIDEPKSSLHFDPENNKQVTVYGDKKTFDGSQESTEVSGRELLKVPTEDAEHKMKSSVWHYLKSFANGILGIWK